MIKMINRKFEGKNKLAIYFTEGMIRFLNDEKKRTGNTKSSIVRRAIIRLMWERLDEKIKNKEKIEQYLVDLMK